MLKSILQQNDPKTTLLVQLMILVLFCMLFAMIGAGVTLLFAKGIGMGDIKGISTYLSENESYAARMNVRTLLLISHVFTFILPCAFFVYLFYKKESLKFLKLKKIPNLTHLPIAGLLIMMSFPIAQFLFWLNKKIPLPEQLMSMETSTGELTKQLMIMNSPAELFLSLFAIAVIPAIGEEILFRGIIQKYLQDAFKRPHLAIFITAIIFSAFHFQFQGFLPRLFLGVVLGYLFYWSGSLWVAIFAHFINNGVQIIVKYMYDLRGEVLNVEEVQDFPFSATAIAAVFVAYLGWQLYKTKIIET